MATQKEMYCFNLLKRWFRKESCLEWGQHFWYLFITEARSLRYCHWTATLTNPIFSHHAWKNQSSTFLVLQKSTTCMQTHMHTYLQDFQEKSVDLWKYLYSSSEQPHLAKINTSFRGSLVSTPRVQPGWFSTYGSAIYLWAREVRCHFVQ